MPRKTRLEKERARKRVVDLRDHPPKNVKKAKNPDLVMVKEIARAHTEVAITELARLARRSRSEAVRLAAIEQLLNRGWGKPAQALAGPDGESPIPVVTEIRRTIIRTGDKDASGNGS